MKKLILTLCVLLLAACGSDPSPVAPTVSVAIAPDVINQGESATLTWTSTDAERVEISGVPGATSPSGVVTITPDASTSYTVTAYGAGTAAVTVQVTVITIIVPPPPPPPPPPIFPVNITVQWTMPTVYTDNTPIPANVISAMSALLFMKSTPAPFTDADLPIAESLPGATSVDFGPVDVNRGATYYFSCKAKTSTGEISAFAPTVTHIWE